MTQSEDPKQLGGVPESLKDYRKQDIGKNFGISFWGPAQESSGTVFTHFGNFGDPSPYHMGRGGGNGVDMTNIMSDTLKNRFIFGNYQSKPRISMQTRRHLVRVLRLPNLLLTVDVHEF